MPSQELAQWVSLIKDILLGIAALVTMALGIYGVRTWKRDLVGKEVYFSAKELVKESHIIHRASGKLRDPIASYERKEFTKEELENTTENERWRLSEAEAYRSRISDFSIKMDKFQEAKLNLRVLIGSKVFESFLPFDNLITRNISLINDYLDIIRDHSITVFPDSPEVLEAQEKLYRSQRLDDDLSQEVANAREAGEVALLALLHRKSIYG